MHSLNRRIHDISKLWLLHHMHKKGTSHTILQNDGGSYLVKLSTDGIHFSPKFDPKSRSLIFEVEIFHLYFNPSDDDILSSPSHFHSSLSSPFCFHSFQFLLIVIQICRDLLRYVPQLLLHTAQNHLLYIFSLYLITHSNWLSFKEISSSIISSVAHSLHNSKSQFEKEHLNEYIHHLPIYYISIIPVSPFLFL